VFSGQVPRIAFEQDFSAREEEDAIANFFDFVHIVRGPQHAGCAGSSEPADLAANVAGGGGIERRGRLVEQQQFRSVDHRLSKSNARLFTRGEQAALGVSEAIEIEIREQRFDAALQFLYAIQKSEDAQIFVNRQIARQRRVHGREIDFLQGSFALMGKVEILNHDFPGSGLEHPEDHADGSSFAGAIGPEQPNNLVLPDMKRDLIDSDSGAVVFAKTFDRQDSLHFSIVPLSSLPGLELRNQQFRCVEYRTARRRPNIIRLMRFIRSERVLALALISASLAQCQTPSQQSTAPKRRIAVFEFENAARSNPAGPYAVLQGAGPDLGKTAADLLITRLVQSGCVVVIERDALNKLLAEQNLTNSDRTNPTTAAKLGQILGVDAIVLGAVTKYDFDVKTSRSGGHAAVMGFGGSSPKIKEDVSGRVEISARVVNVDTAQVLSASQGDGVVARSEKVDYSEMSAVMMGKGQLHDSVMSDAMDKAISQLAAGLEKTLPEVPLRALVINGLVADASDSGRLILNVGALSGIKRGDRLQIWRSGKEIRDPATGQVLTRDDRLLGDATVESVENAFSVAAYHGSEPVKVGDIVKSPVKQ